MWWQDLRIATRRLRRQPAFALTAVATLALGIGANLSVAAYVQGFLLSPVNAPDSDELIRVVRRSPNGATTGVIPWPDYMDVRAATPGVDLAAHAFSSVQLERADASEMRPVELVTGNYFRVLGAAPAAGRLIDEGDDQLGAPPVVVLREGYWRTRFDADPAAVGRSLVVNGVPFEIIGVAPAGFHGTYHARSSDLWVPVTTQEVVRPRGLSLESRNWGWLLMIGRRAPDVSLEAAQGQLDAAAAGVNRRFPPGEPAQALGLLATPADAIRASDRDLLSPFLTAALAFTALLFVVACANLAGVMQARLLGRRRELAIRQSIGAGRRRVLAEWLTECLLLALLGGAAGLATARVAVAWLGTLRPPPQLVGDMALATRFDWRLAAWALGLSLVAAVAFGLLPAWRVGRLAPVAWLREESGMMTGGRAAVRLRRSAVVIQLALSGVLLVAATLLGRSLSNQQAFDPGFDTTRLGVLSIDLQRRRVPEEEWRPLVEAALERVRLDPDVRAADVGSNVPLGFAQDARGFRIPGYTPPGPRDYVVLDASLVGADYFRALGVPFVQGGPWAATLSPAGGRAVVINQTMAREYWGERNPVGESIDVLPGGPAVIAGVVRDVAYYEIGAEPVPYVYLAAESVMPGTLELLVRTTDEPGPVIERLARVLESIDPRLSPHEAMTFEALRQVPLFPARLLATAAVAFAAMAVLLAGVGLYGVVTMSVGQRTREIGVRMALGARPAAVLRGVLREAVLLAAAGLAIALAGGFVAGGLLRAWLFEVSRFDAGAYGLVAALLVGLSIVAAWLPARRAARIDPVQALRS